MEDIWAARHNACPFGDSASGYNWGRMGERISCSMSAIHHALLPGWVLLTLGRRILHTPLLAHVDDYFSVEAKETSEHAMQCFARSGTAHMRGTSLT